MLKTEREVSAGGVVFEKIDDKYNVLLIGRKNNTVLCLPKGKIEKGESVQETALREVNEETGANAEIISHLNDVHYWYCDMKRQRRLNKTVHFFLMEFKGGDITKHDTEVDSVAWFDIEDAIAKVSYESEKHTLEKARDLFFK
ncbi:MAG: NUDIX hydrolase [Candidatus Omnitrophica bacterium]|nr:NUDIX hydrolase [Candidatus Omnitrophota bacterium]